MVGDNQERQYAAFYQTGWQVHGGVYNVNGDLILSQNSSKADFIKVLEEFKADIEKLPGLEQDKSTEIQADMSAAIREAGLNVPSKDIVINRLNSVKSTLEAVRGSVQAAWDVAKTLGSIARWATVFF